MAEGNGNGNGQCRVIPTVLPVPLEGTKVTTVKVGSIPKQTGEISLKLECAYVDTAGLRLLHDTVERGRLVETCANDMVFVDVEISSDFVWPQHGNAEVNIVVSSGGKQIISCPVAFGADGSDEVRDALADPAAQQIVAHRDAFRKLRESRSAAAAAGSDEPTNHNPPEVVEVENGPTTRREGSDVVEATVITETATPAGDQPTTKPTDQPTTTTPETVPDDGAKPTPEPTATGVASGSGNGRSTVNLGEVTVDAGDHSVEINVRVNPASAATGTTPNRNGRAPGRAARSETQAETDTSTDEDEVPRYRKLTIILLAIAGVLMVLAFLAGTRQLAWLPLQAMAPCILGAVAASLLAWGVYRWPERPKLNAPTLWAIGFAVLSVISITLGG